MGAIYHPKRWKDKARQKFRRDLARNLRGCGPALDQDPRFLYRVLQFMVRYRGAAETFMKIARRYKQNIPRMELEDFEEAANLAKVSEVMES